MRGAIRHTVASMLVTALLNTSVRGTSTGLSTDPAGPMWNRGDPSTAFAIFDTYPSFTFSNDPPDSGGGFTSPSLTQTSTTTGNPGVDQGAGIYSDIITQTPGNDIYFGGARGGSFSFAATTPFSIKGFFLQLKRSANTANLTAVTPLLNGIAADSVSSISGTDDSHSNGLYSVTTWFWGSSLAAQSITNPTLTFTLPNQRGIDAVVIDAGPVPEPAALGLIGLAGLAVLHRTRR